MDSIKKTYVPVCGERKKHSIPAAPAEADDSERAVESVGTGKSQDGAGAPHASTKVPGFFLVGNYTLTVIS